MRQNKDKFEQEIEKKTEIINFKTGEVLDDRNINGKKRPWRERKTENIKYADYLADLEFRKAKSVHECADKLFFHIDENGEKKLYQTWFCKSRLCPMCAWRRGLKVQIQLSKVLDQGKLAVALLPFLGASPQTPSRGNLPLHPPNRSPRGQVEQASCPTKEKFIVVLPVKGSLRHFASLVPLTGGNIELLSNQRTQNVSKAQAT